MGCCGKPPADAAEKEPKSLKKRFCTDVLCLAIFFAFIVVLAVIFYMAYATGDWQSIVYDADYLGNRCGVGDKAALKKAFYPRIPRDMMEQNEVVQSGDFWKLKLYALCVASCPTTFDVNNPSFITDYGYDPASATTQALGAGTQAQWLSATPTLNILNRCIPRTESNQNEVSMCAYPKCTDADVVASGATCATGASWTNGEWEICGTGVSKADCDTRMDLCKVKATETLTTTYELNSNDEASAAMMASIASTVGGVFEIISAIGNAYLYIIVGGVVAPIALALAYMLLLFLFAKIVIYGLLIVLVLCELAATFICLAKSGLSFQGNDASSVLGAASAATNVTVPDSASAVLEVASEEATWIYAIAFLVLAVLTVMTIIMIITSRKKIRIAAAIIKEATTVFTKQPMLLLFPTFSTIAQILVVLWFVVTGVLVYTTKPEKFDIALGKMVDTQSAAFQALGQPEAAANVDPIESLRGIMENDNIVLLMGVIVLYGFFVLIQFVGGVAWCTMSSTVYYWYFFQNNKDEKQSFIISRNLGRTLFYHTGSIAFSAFIIALCDMLRAACAYLEKQMGPTNNLLVKLAFKALNCCLACLKKTVKFISYYGLVWVGCQGTSFCSGCFKTFFFFLQNPGQVAINALVTWLLKWTSLLSMPLACGCVFYYIIPTDSAGYPAVIITIVAALMTVSWLTVFDCAITTIFVCCFQDKAEFGSRFMSSDHTRLAKAFGVKVSNKDTDAKADASDDGKTGDEKEVKQSL